MKKLTVANLKKVSLTQSAPVEKTVHFSLEGEDYEAQVFVRKLSFKDQEQILKAYKWKFDTKDIENSKLERIDGIRLQAARILGSICEDAKGTPFFKSIEEVLDCDVSVCNAFYSASDDVNNFMGKLMKKSSNETNSGASSSVAESVEKPSRKRSKT
ncbi:phage tail assembly chaperone family protein, TAC [Acinetobacter baumannii]|uniref:phage tail assembly chaperone family protein, TAC n=1 Tax=Acinetobacter baumannii TaxID=470 RepID=UPI0011276A75|nr:phage tail assembly chaperone family protein, TAC [Acinetobacter baumannii]EHU2721388.1 phage tail assembly chaperone family protein, TAC [Acinetobacter baumannii]TPT71242.1 hypothetical protein FJU58_18250 [Acinetobacter baumannii]